MGLIFNYTVSIPIDHLTVESCDLKSLDTEHYYKLLESVRRFGQLRNVLVTAEGRVIEGRRIVGIMKELGYHTVEAKVMAEDEQGFIARLNLDSEYSTFDFIKVSIQLCKQIDLTKKDAYKDVLPFKNDDIDDYIDSFEFSFAKYNTHSTASQSSLF